MFSDIVIQTFDDLQAPHQPLNKHNVYKDNTYHRSQQRHGKPHSRVFSSTCLADIRFRRWLLHAPSLGYALHQTTIYQPQGKQNPEKQRSLNCEGLHFRRWLMLFSWKSLAMKASKPPRKKSVPGADDLMSLDLSGSQGSYNAIPIMPMSLPFQMETYRIPETNPAPHSTPTSHRSPL